MFERNMKKGVLLGIIISSLLFSINLVSASFWSSFSATLGSNPPITLALMGLFLLFYSFLDRLVFSKLFRGTRAISVVVSLLFSISAIWGISQMNLEYLFSSWGLQENMLILFGLIVMLIGAFFVSRKKDKLTGKRKFQFKVFFLIVGIILILFGLIAEDLVYRNGVLIWAGVIIAVLSILFGWIIKKKDRSSVRDSGAYGPSPQPNKKRNYPRGSINELKRLAKNFRRRAERTRNPAFEATYLKFIHYLTNLRYGRNPAEICNYFGIGLNQLVKIFNVYGIVYGGGKTKPPKRERQKKEREMRPGIFKGMNIRPQDDPNYVPPKINKNVLNPKLQQHILNMRKGNSKGMFYNQVKNMNLGNPQTESSGKDFNQNEARLNSYNKRFNRRHK
jgi:hypothetical protein